MTWGIASQVTLKSIMMDMRLILQQNASDKRTSEVNCENFSHYKKDCCEVKLICCTLAVEIEMRNC